MSATDEHLPGNTAKSYGELMNCLLKARELYATEEEFKGYALAEVRRFITDLRTLEIEIALRPQTGRLSFASPKE